MLMRLSDIVQPVPKTQPGVQGYISQQCMNMWVLWLYQSAVHEYVGTLVIISVSSA